jgi:hypothetical protein
MNAPGWPLSDVRMVRSDPDFRPEASAMKFRLTYAGPLMGSAGSNNRVDNKHAIRRAFHPQLKQYWEHHPFLREWRGEETEHSKRLEHRRRMSDELADRFARCGYRFVPLVIREWELSCSLEILFLRAGWPGGVIHGGDIDNRLKTLFDALRLPSDANELGKQSAPLDGEDPFFCLMEDDALITQVSVDTDVLLERVTDTETDHDARLVITVSLGPARVTMRNTSFGGR